MVRIPIAPTSSEIPAMAVTAAVMIADDAAEGVQHLGLGGDGEVLLAAVARGERAP